MPVYINYIGTANPTYKTDQMQIGKFMADALQMNATERHQLNVLYRASGIQTRYSVLEDYGKTDEYQFFPNTSNLEPFPTVGARMSIYEREAIQLAQQAIQDALPDDFNLSSITHLITVSCTGMYAPGIDIQLIQALNLPTDIQRTAINFMGCYAAFNALKSAYHVIKSEPHAKVLIVAVELCSLHFQKAKDEDTLLANALFGDGAAAVLLSSQVSEQKASLSIENFYSDLAFDGIQEMAWRINDTGFEMRLSAKIPAIIQANITILIQRLLNKLSLSTDQVSHFAIHPGGRRILRIIEQELNISKADNRFAYEILKEYGNMSSPTVLFVMQKILQNLTTLDHGNHMLSLAFGPGLTLESMLLNIHYAN